MPEVLGERYIYLEESMDSAGICALSTVIVLYFTKACLGMPNTQVLRI
jgi:hypothetical protein